MFDWGIRVQVNQFDIESYQNRRKTRPLWRAVSLEIPVKPGRGFVTSVSAAYEWCTIAITDMYSGSWLFDERYACRI